MKRCVVTLLLAFSLVPQTQAHDIEADRLTIVQREPLHLSLTFYVDELQLMHRLIAPQATRAEFLLASAAAPPNAMVAKIETARLNFARQIDIRNGGGVAIKISALHWRPASETQQHLARAAMSLVATGSDHDQLSSTEITFDAIAETPLDRVTFKAPAALNELLVVSYRPVQQRTNEQVRTLDIQF